MSALPVPTSTTLTPGAISLPSFGPYFLIFADAAKVNKGATAAVVRPRAIADLRFMVFIASSRCSSCMDMHDRRYISTNEFTCMQSDCGAGQQENAQPDNVASLYLLPEFRMTGRAILQDEMQDMLRRQFGRIGFLWNRALAEQAAAAHRQAGAHAHVIGDDGRRAFGLGGQSV